MKRNIFQKQDDPQETVNPMSGMAGTTNSSGQAKADDQSASETGTNSGTEYNHVDIINLVNISQVYSESNPPNTVFANFNLSIKDIARQGQFITLMGKSGCGKSTLLRYISGLQEPTSGEVYLYGNKRTDADRIPMVFQQYTSFEWKTVLENVALPLILKGIPKKEANERAMEMIKIVDLMGHEQKWAKYPTLSGGQLQRVAIARNLVVNPQILLMDEPFGALDTVTRKQMQVFLRSLFEKAKIDPTVILVTHSESEAVFLSTDIYILGSNPATICHHVKVNLPDKREDSLRYTTEYSDYVNKIGLLMEDLKKPLA